MVRCCRRSSLAIPAPGARTCRPSAVLANDPLTHGSLARRCTAVPIDFFGAVPADADCYVLKQIVHDWNDQDALRILRNVRSAIRPDGRLLLIDIVLKAGNEPDPGRGLDMHMLVTLKGRERTAAEVEVLRRPGWFRANACDPHGRLAIHRREPAGLDRSHFRFWPDSDLPAHPLFRRSWERSGHQSANTSGRDL